MKTQGNTATFLLLLLSSLVFGTCTSRQAVSPKSPDDMNMKPFVEPEYGAPIPLSPSDDLLKALQRAHKSKKLVKLPILLMPRESGYGQYDKAYISASADLPTVQHIEVKLLDGALGISLEDRAQQYCNGGPCCLWLIGYWDEAPLGAAPRTTVAPHTFGLRSVVGPMAEGAVSQAFIEK